MPKSKITPPPWFVKHNPKRLAVRNADGDYVAESIRGGGGEAEANATLIAAAPDLLAACEAVLSELLMAQENAVNVAGEGSEEAKAFEPAIRQAQTAIAKAKGTE